MENSSKENIVNDFMYNTILTPRNLKIAVMFALFFFINIITFYLLRYIFAEKMQLLTVKIIVIESYLFLDTLIILLYLIIKYYKLKVLSNK